MVVNAPVPSLIFCPHPLLPAANRRIEYIEFAPGESIAEYLARVGIRLRGPARLEVDGYVVPCDEWAHVCPQPGSLITLRALAAGGGGGDSDPMPVVLSLALMVAAPGLGAGLAGWALEAGVLPMGVLSTATWNMIGAGLISVGGSLLIGALTQPPRPNLAQAQARGAQASPTYSLTGGSNRARPYEPMQLVLGKHRVFPDYAAKPFTRFEGDDQVLYQAFHFGLGDVLLSDFRIGTTPLTDFSDYEIEIAPYSGRLGKIPANVDAIAGAALDPGVWVTRQGALGSYTLAVEITGTLLAYAAGGYGAAEVEVAIEYRKVGDPDWIAFAPGEVTQNYTHYWSAGYSVSDEGGTWWIQQDYGTTTAGDHNEADPHATIPGATWHWRPFAEVGVGEATPPSSYQVAVDTVMVSNADAKPVRKSYSREVPSGQYEVRVKRLSADLGTTGVDDLVWSQLLCYGPDTADYTNQVRVGLKIKASGQLQGQIQQFSALASARNQVWDGVGVWAQHETSNPAWLALALARGKTIDARLVYGGGLADARIELDAWKAFGAWCDSKSLQFNGVIDRSMSLAEAIDAVCRAGRGSKTWASGKLGVVWDAPNQPVSGVYGMGNIIAGSYRIDYITEKLAEEIVVNFTNPDLDWQQDSVRALVPGVVTPTRTSTVDLWGCAASNAVGAAKDQAGREANLIAADQYYHNARISFECDIEGYVNTRGDTILLAHDIMRASWGWSGRLADGSTAGVLQLDTEVTFTEGQDHYVLVKKPDATFGIYAVTYQAGSTDQITLTAPGLPFNPSADADGHPVYDYVWMFDLRATPGRKVKIIDHEPTDTLRNIRIVCVDDSADYYDAEDGEYTYTAPATYGGEAPTLADLEVTESIVPVADGYVVRLTLTWDVTAGRYDHARVRAGWGGAPLQEKGQPAGRRFDLDVPDGVTVDIEVTGIHPLYGVMGSSSQLTTQHVVTGLASAATPPNVAGLALAGGGTTFAGPDAEFVWTAVEMAYFLDYEIEIWSQMPALITTEHAKSPNYAYTFQRNYETNAGAPIRTLTAKVFARNLLEARSAVGASLTVSNPAPAAPA